MVHVLMELWPVGECEVEGLETVTWILWDYVMNPRGPDWLAEWSISQSAMKEASVQKTGPWTFILT
jgi:hypothetical protein